VDLFHELNEHLLELLRSLSTDDWHKPTVCSEWCVKDIASHLLHGTIRRLSFQRDSYSPPEAVQQINSYEELVRHLHRLNSEWTVASRRISPQMLIQLLENTHQELVDCLRTLDPFESSPFSVAWAGEDVSLHWFDIAREYTEKWHHQQQIVDAINGKSSITSRRLYYPVLDTFIRALPHTYRNVHAADGTLVTVRITGESGGEWTILRRDEGWHLFEGTSGGRSQAVVSLGQETAWKLFTKRTERATAKERFSDIEFAGVVDLGEHVLDMVSIVA
jgi:uncharacterized protein (TIGR03083 family)